MFDNRGTIYGELHGLRAIGSNIKADGQHRQWNAVLTGKLKQGNNGLQCHVIDLEIQEENIERKANGERLLNEKRWLSLWSFTGTIGEIKITEGRRDDGITPIFNV